MTQPNPALHRPAMLPGLLDGGPVMWRCHTCRSTITTLLPLRQPPTCNGQWRHRPIPMDGTRLTEGET